MDFSAQRRDVRYIVGGTRIDGLAPCWRQSLDGALTFNVQMEASPLAMVAPQNLPCATARFIEMSRLAIDKLM